jgi:hypothetical protein
MTSYFKVSLAEGDVVQCWTCGALVPGGGKMRHDDWHAGLVSEVRQALLAEAQDAGSTA